MRIVEAGARNDLGQLDAALLTLRDFGLDRASVQPWSARVWYAYADLLLAAGRADEAREWFLAAAGADQDGTTDADERLLELDGVEIITDDEDEYRRRAISSTRPSSTPWTRRPWTRPDGAGRTRPMRTRPPPTPKTSTNVDDDS